MKQLVLLLLTLFCFSLYGQNSTGTISGAVHDPSSALLPGARVTALNEATGLRREMLTNSEGLYNLPLLPVGVYSLTVEKEGFKRQVQTGIRVEILQVRSVDFKLDIGAVSETVTVESRAPLSGVGPEKSARGEQSRPTGIRKLS